MIIGCTSLVYWHGRIVAIRCAKGRGTILPGGKWEEGETFAECAARELLEEAGLVATWQRFIYGGMSTDGAFVQCFLTHVKEVQPYSCAEGEMVLATWGDLLTSRFKAYYEVLRDVLRQQGFEQ